MTTEIDESYFDAIDLIDWCTDNGWDINRLLNACETTLSFEGMVQDILTEFLEAAPAGGSN